MAFATYADAVAALRRYINDTPQLNTLDQDYESTDDELEDFIKDALNDINFQYEPQTGFQLKDIVVEPGVDQGSLAWSMVKKGAVLELLRMKGIISARNAITYSDAGGVTVAEMDKWGRYLNFFNALATDYERRVMQLKRRENISNVFGGGVNSPLGWDYYYG